MTPVTASALDLAAAHVKAGRLAEAERLLRDALSRDPHEAPLIHLLALLRQRLGDAREAEALLRRAVALEPEAVEHRVRLGQLLSTVATTPARSSSSAMPSR